MTEANYAAVKVFIPKGRIDHLTSETFKLDVLKMLEEVKSSNLPLILDFSDVSYISSIGLRSLMVIKKEFEAIHCKVVLCGMQETVKEVFRISRFNFLFQIFDTQLQAKDAI